MPKRPDAGSLPKGALWLPGADVHALALELVGLALAAGARERLAPPHDLDVHESRPLNPLEVLSFQESAADSGGPDGDVLASGRRNILVHDDVGDLQPAAGTQRPEGLAEHAVLVGREVDHSVGDDEINARIVHRQ